MKLAPIVLTAAEVQALEQAAATGAHARERKRAQAVLRGYPNRQLYQVIRAQAKWSIAK